MSKETEEAAKKLREWKEDIEKRCDEHLQKYPEHKPIKKAFARPKFAMPTTFVQVLESSVNRGSWNVWNNGVLEETFVGPLAQAAALKYAVRLMNEGNEWIPEHPPLAGLPRMCLFCGNRFVHRTDCPDAKKDGPEYPQLPPVPGYPDY